MSIGSLAGQTAIVTGGARGIGRGIGRSLQQAGARLVVWDLDPTDAADLRPAHVQRVDVANLVSVEAAMAATLAAVRQIDILVNNAGVNGPSVPAWQYPPDAWHKVLSVDLTGVFHCCRVTVPHMLENGYGRIINVASIAGKEGNPLNSAYCAAKAGVIGFTKSLAAEVATSGITVNAIAPAITETELLKEMTSEYIAGRKARIPMGRFCTVDEIASMVAFVASPACSFTTGFTFDVTGGRASY